MPGPSLNAHSIVLSAVAGYVDAAGFASLIGLFPAHLTGELVGDAIAFSSGHARDHRTHLWMLPVFIGSVILASLVARLLRRRGLRPLAGLLALVTLALAAFSFSDPVAHALHAAIRTQMLVGGGLAVAAMGFQNALMREALRASCPTTVMTGNLTQVVIDLSDRAFSKILRPSPHDRRPRSRLGAVGWSLLAFVGCAFLGGFLTRTFGSTSVFLPTMVTALLGGYAWHEDQVRRAQASLIGGLGDARVPTFDAPKVWPDSLVPPNSAAPMITPAAYDPVSMTQMRVAKTVADPKLPTPRPQIPFPDPKTPVGIRAGEKRSISGTRLAQRFREKDEE